MELREWLIILGLALVTLIVIDGVRRLQRQRRTPRLDEVEGDVFGTTQNLSEQDSQDPEQEAREAEMNWELPNGGARVLKRADFSSVQPKPKLERQEHPGPSRVLHEFRASHAKATTEASASVAGTSVPDAPRAAEHASAGMDGARPEAAATAPSEPRVAAEPHRGDAQVASESDSDHAGQGTATANVAPTADQDRHASREGTESPQLDRTESPLLERTESPQLERTESPELERTESPELERTESPQLERTESPQDAERRREPVISARRDEEVAVARTKGETSEPLAADPDDHDDFDEDQYRLVDFEGMGDSLKSSSRRVGSSMQRFGASLQKNLAERREQKRLERERREALKAEKAAEAARQAEARAEHQARREAELEAAKEAERLRLAELREQQERDAVSAREAAGDVEYRDAVGDGHADAGDGNDEAAEFAPAQDDNVRTHPVLEKALRHDVNAEKARDSLSGAEEIIVISVMSRDEGGFPGTTLLELMMACGLRYSREMGIFHRFETEDADSALQFSMVNVLKPGTFPIEAMDDFTTPGITLLMPLPSADDTSAAFEAMVETAMVIVRHMGGELKDENRSVMTAQTVEFARQRVQEFERRHRLHRYQVN